MIRFPHLPLPDGPDPEDGRDSEGGLKPEEELDPKNGPAPELSEMERIGDEIAELAARISAAECRLLDRLRRFDALFQEGGGLTGFKTTAHWLAWRTSMALGAARERVRVARALGELPRVSEAMRKGQLSYSKVRAITRVQVKNEEMEEEMVRLARQATAAHLETLVRKWKQVERWEELEKEAERHRSRELSLRPDDDGSWVVRGRLDPEVGALLERALEMAGEVLYRKERRKLRSAEAEGADPAPQAERLEGEGEDEDEGVTAAQRRADAVGLLAESVLQNGLVPDAGVRADESEQEEGEQKEKEEECDVAAGSKPTRPIGRADRFQVVVHVDAEALREDGEGGEAFLEDGLRVSDLMEPSLAGGWETQVAP